MEPYATNEQTNTRDGLEKGQNLLMSHGCGQKNVQRIIVLLTDGLSNTGIRKEKGLIEASKAIQKSGTMILVVAIGQFSDHQLKKMVPSDNIYRTKGDKSTLNDEEFVHKIKEAICGNIGPKKGKESHF